MFHRLSLVILELSDPKSKLSTLQFPVSIEGVRVGQGHHPPPGTESFGPSTLTPPQPQSRSPWEESGHAASRQR